MTKKEELKKYSGGFLYNPETKQVFLHRRDGNTIYNPNMLAFFGGLNEGVETPKEGFQRELFEEVGLRVPLDEIIPLNEYLNKEVNTYRYVFYVVSDISKDALVLGEGAGFDWFDLKTVFQERITEKVDKDLKTFITLVK